jgi:hypothetical protein
MLKRRFRLSILKLKLLIVKCTLPVAFDHRLEPTVALNFVVNRPHASVRVFHSVATEYGSIQLLALPVVE